MKAPALNRLAMSWSGFRHNFSFTNRFQVTYNRLFRRDLPLATYIWKKRFFFVCNTRLGDHISLQECFCERAYDLLLDRCRFPSNRITYVNIGANIGCFDVLLLERGLSIERGVAVELNPLTYARCLINFSTNDMSAVHAVNAGVAGTNGSFQFHPCRLSLSDSLYTPLTQDSGEGMQVDLLTLESLLELHGGNIPQFDLLKLDCECAEYAILRLSSLAVLRRFRHLIIEFHPPPEGESLAAAYARLKEAGFVPALGPRPDEPRFTDLFIRS